MPTTMGRRRSSRATTTRRGDASRASRSRRPATTIGTPRVLRDTRVTSVFRPPAIRSFVVGDWLLVSMDSEKNRASQTTALRSLLANDGHRCELLYFHHPRYSSGEHGNQPQVEPWWDVADAANVDLILNGHDHSYERFGLIRGIREVVVGTGGVNTRGFGAVQAGSRTGSQATRTGASSTSNSRPAGTPGSSVPRREAQVRCATRLAERAAADSNRVIAGWAALAASRAATYSAALARHHSSRSPSVLSRSSATASASFVRSTRLMAAASMRLEVG